MPFVLDLIQTGLQEWLQDNHPDSYSMGETFWIVDTETDKLHWVERGENVVVDSDGNVERVPFWKVAAIRQWSEATDGVRDALNA